MSEESAEPKKAEQKEGFEGCIVWLVIGCFFLCAFGREIPNLIFPQSKWTYAFRYETESKYVIIDKKPHDCEWGAAPIGRKHCHYEKVVTVTSDVVQVWDQDASGKPVRVGVKPYNANSGNQYQDSNVIKWEIDESGNPYQVSGEQASVSNNSIDLEQDKKTNTSSKPTSKAITYVFVTWQKVSE